MEEYKNREQDRLAAAFKEKLANHSMPVDSALWDGIAAKVAAANKSGAGVRGSSASGGVQGKRLWLISLSAVASLALLISVGWYLLSDPVPDSGKPVAAVSGSVADKMPVREKVVAIAAEQPKETPVIHNLPALVPEVVSETPDDAGTTDSDQDFGMQMDSKSAVDYSSDKEKEQPALRTSGERATEKLTSEGDWTEMLPERKHRKPMLLASVGSGMAGSDPGLSGHQSEAMYESFIGAGNRPVRAAAALAPADFKNRDYQPALSAGLKLRLPVSDSWSVETGLQYSYLQTKLSDAGWSGYWADLQLHYLGVPVGFAATLARSSNWELYWSGGAMVEKGLHSLYREYRDWGTAVFTTTASSRVDGWQWSVYTSLGAGYHLDKHLMLYFDPQLAYFFDNGQPLSIRTGMPLMVGLSAGLRVTF